MHQLQKMIYNQKIKFNRKIDPRVCRLIKRILKIDPQQRPSCTEILSDPGLKLIARKYQISLSKSKNINENKQK